MQSGLHRRMQCPAYSREQAHHGGDLEARKLGPELGDAPSPPKDLPSASRACSCSACTGSPTSKLMLLMHAGHRRSHYLLPW